MTSKRSQIYSLLRLWLVLVPAVLLTSLQSCSGTEWNLNHLRVKFDSKEVYHVNLLNRLYWVEKNERSTSKDFKGWEETDMYLFEWPGNVTTFKESNPVVRWGRKRAKYIEDHCAQEHTGIEMRAYAYKYVYLTWGPNRLTQTYTSPLTIPRHIIPSRTLSRLNDKKFSYEENRLNSVVVYDIAFVFDTLLLAWSEGVIRVSGLEMGWAEMAEEPKRALVYSTSKGIDEGVDNLVVQSCCLKTRFCPYGNVVVAYRENSFPHVVYVSLDSGETFSKVLPASKSETGFLRLVLSYPESQSIFVFYEGGNGEIKRSRMEIMSQALDKNQIAPKMLETKTILYKTYGRLHGARLGMESSYVLWDKCDVWYSADISRNLSRSLLYVHKKIGETKFNEIVSQRCTFGNLASLAYGKGGTYGLLDKMNIFYLGVDSKSTLSQLVALKMDMSLMLPGTEPSIVPFFDATERPVLLYPPKFLSLPEEYQKRLDRTYYHRRLGMRLLPKNVYPSDFIRYFFAENVKHIDEKHKALLLVPCETSSLHINGSISQQRKFYRVAHSKSLSFSVRFKSKLGSASQLKFEPRSVLKYLSVRMNIMSIDQIDLLEPAFWIKYEVEIKSGTISSIGKTFRLNFFTKNALRCHFQPRVPIYIKVENMAYIPKDDYHQDKDMAKSVYLKSVTGGETEYLNLKEGTGITGSRAPPSSSQVKGEQFKVDTCPLSKMKPT